MGRGGYAPTVGEVVGLERLELVEDEARRAEVGTWLMSIRRR